MKVTWCPECHTRYKDDTKFCHACGRRTKWIKACPRCGHRFWSSNFSKHFDWCQSVPKPEEMADMLDDDPNLTVGGLIGMFGGHRSNGKVDTGIVRHLSSTRWTKKRLDVRGHQAQRNKASEAMGGDKSVPTTPCGRCLVLGQELDDEGICEECRREMRASLARLGRPKNGFYPNQYDLKYFTKLITA